MDVAIVFLGLTTEEARGKGVSDPESWSSDSPPFRRIKSTVFELFQATHEGKHSLIETPREGSTNLYVFGARMTAEGKYVSSVNRESDEYKAFLKSPPGTTFLCSVFMPEPGAGGMGKLLQQSFAITTPFPWQPDITVYCLLPIFGHWYAKDQDEGGNDVDNFYLPYPRPGMYKAESGSEYNANLDTAAVHNFNAMKALKPRPDALVGGKASLADQYDSLFGCSYCKQKQQQQFGCGFCKNKDAR